MQFIVVTQYKSLGLSLMWAAEKYPDGGSSRHLYWRKEQPVKWLKIVQHIALWSSISASERLRLHQSINDKLNKMSKIFLFWQCSCQSSKLFYNGKILASLLTANTALRAIVLGESRKSLLPLSGDCRYPILYVSTDYRGSKCSNNKFASSIEYFSSCQHYRWSMMAMFKGK